MIEKYQKLEMNLHTLIEMVYGNLKLEGNISFLKIFVNNMYNIINNKGFIGFGKLKMNENALLAEELLCTKLDTKNIMCAIECRFCIGKM